MISVVMLDLIKKETYVEVFMNNEDYQEVFNANSDNRHPSSIFESNSIATREARRVAKRSSGWVYNNTRDFTVDGGLQHKSMNIVRTLKDWQIIKVNGFYMIQHIPSKEYLGGKNTLTARKDIDSKINWRLDSFTTANKKLKFVAGEREPIRKDRIKTILYNDISFLIDETFEQYEDSKKWYNMMLNELGTTSEELEELGIVVTADGKLYCEDDTIEITETSLDL